MFMGIGEKQLAQIDNEQNREIVRNNIINDYKKKYIEVEDSISHRALNILKTKLSTKKLHELLVLDADDADAIIWNELFSFVKYEVCELCYGAKRFFEVGGAASLNEDEYWDEYHIMMGFIPESTREFVAIKDYSQMGEWDKLIKNVVGYIKAVVPTKCKWVAYSNDGAYEDFSRGVFEDKKSCYNDMRNAVLNKMKWNTEFDEDFTEADDAVGYKVRFAQDMIIHASFSGIYVYKIVGENDVVKKEDIFTDEFNEWLKQRKFFDYV